MRQILITLLFLALCFNSFAQNYTPLKEALKKPNAYESVLLQPNEGRQINKFIHKLDKFYNLQTVYIQRGFDAEQLQTLITGLKNQELVEVIVECDTLKPLIKILAQLEGTDKIILIEPFTMKADALNDIAKLQCASLSLKSSTRIKIPKDFQFPKQLEEIELLSKQPAKNYLLVDKMAGLEKLIALYISTENVATLPNNIGAIPNLKNLEIIKAKEIDKENELISQRFRMAKKAHECNKLVTITYTSSTEMTDAERPAFATVFDGFYFMNEAEIPANNAKLSINDVASTETFASVVGFTPLVASVDVKRKPFKISTETPTQIEVNTGTKIVIPQNAFVDGNGNPVTGQVDITYREIKTPVDMLMSGVPMAYDSAGKTYQFVSAGNFELLAFKDGQPLELAQNKTIDISFVSTDAQAGYNLYKLDSETNNWAFEGNADNKKKPLPDSSGIKSITIKDLDFEYDFDTTAFEERFAKLEYRYMLEANQVKGEIREVNKKRNGPYLYGFNRKVNTKLSLVKVKIENKGKLKSDSSLFIKFKLAVQPRKKFNKTLFTELSSFRGYTFVTNDITTPKSFKTEYIQQQRYNDIRILYNDGDDFCTIQLKKADEIIELTADITQGESGVIAKYRKYSFQRRYKRYNRALNKRMTRLNNALDIRKKTARDAFNIADNSQTAAISRNLQLTGLGTYNCDAFMRFETPPTVITNVIVTTKDTSGFSPKTIFVVDRRINGLLTYSSPSISLYKSSTKAIIAVDDNENIYCIDMPAKQAIDKNTIQMKQLDLNTLKTSKDFIEQVGL